MFHQAKALSACFVAAVGGEQAAQQLLQLHLSQYQSL